MRISMGCLTLSYHSFRNTTEGDRGHGEQILRWRVGFVSSLLPCMPRTQLHVCNVVSSHPRIRVVLDPFRPPFS